MLHAVASVTMTTIDLTSNEKAVLAAIRDSEYRDGDLTQPVWSNDLDVPAGMTRAGMGGVFASLRAKGMVRLSGSGKESTVVFTATAIEILEGGAL